MPCARTRASFTPISISIVASSQNSFHDVVGYYNRFDIFDLSVNRRRLSAASFTSDPASRPASGRLPEPWPAGRRGARWFANWLLMASFVLAPFGPRHDSCEVGYHY